MTLFFRICFLCFTALMLSCSSVPAWTGKYERLDGEFTIYSKANRDLIEVTIVNRGGSPKDENSILVQFLAKTDGNRAKEMQLCREGECAKECLSSLTRSTQGMFYEECLRSELSGVYR